MNLSVIIIAKNAEEKIGDAIESVKNLADEVIVIDNSSKDKTKEVSEKHGVKVYDYKSNDFSDIRNFGMKVSQDDWLLYVDVDERVSKELAEEIKSKLKNSRFSAFKLKRKNFYLGDNEWPYVEKLERLFKKNALKGWYGKIHESPLVEGKIGVLDGYLLHYTHRDLSSMLDKTIEWSKIEADLRFKANHPKMTLWRFLRVMTTAFFDSYIRQGGWRVGIPGLIESIYQSYSIFITYARLWELQQKNKFKI